MRKYKATTNSNHNDPVQDNVLNQTFVAQKPGQVWMSDITSIPTDEGWLYLASLEDLYTRKTVGWHAASRMTKELVIQALERAIGGRNQQGQCFIIRIVAASTPLTDTRSV